MKKIVFNILLLLGMIGVCAGCSDSDYDIGNLVPEQYHKVLYFKDNGKQTLFLNTTQTEYRDSLCVLKAGSDPSLLANVKVELMTQQEIEKAYGSDGENYKIIPEDAFSFDKGQKLSFGSNERGKLLYFTVNAMKIFRAIQSDLNVKYVLPLKLTSVQDTINSNKRDVLIAFDVKEPKIEMNGNIINESMLYKTIDINLTASLNNISANDWDFTCGFNTVNGQELVEAYNKDHNVNYELLPAKAIASRPDFNFVKGHSLATSVLNIKRDLLINDHTYILPLKLASSSMGEKIRVSDQITYVVLNNPKYGYVIPNRNDWKILFCNCDNIFYQSPGYFSSGAPAVLDNDVNTFWMYGVDSPYWYESQFNGDDYNYEFKDYHAFYGDRNTPGTQTFVIDMKMSRTIIGIGIIDNQKLDGCLKDAEFFVSDDSEFKFKPQKQGGTAADYDKVALNSWTRLFRYQDIPSQKDISWHRLTNEEIKNNQMVKGRFLKMVIWAGSRGGNNHGSCIAEIKAMQLIAIDGVPISN